MGDYANFYNSKDNDRIYDADSFAEWLRPFFVNGVFEGELQVTANDDMTVTVQTGNGYINGKMRYFGQATTLDIEAANASLSRIDSIVLRRDDANRNFILAVVKGGASSEPVAPTPTRENGVYELVLAHVAVAAAAIKITQADITDTRTDTDLCGYVTSTVKSIDYSQFAAAFQDYYTNFVNGNQADFAAWKDAIEKSMQTWFSTNQGDFDTWFASIKDKLGTDVAGSLQLQIDRLSASLPAGFDTAHGFSWFDGYVYFILKDDEGNEVLDDEGNNIITEKHLIYE